MANANSNEMELSTDTCHGCGERGHDLARIDAIVVTSFLERRLASLLDDPRHSFRHRDLGRGTALALQPAVHASRVSAKVGGAPAPGQ